MSYNPDIVTKIQPYTKLRTKYMIKQEANIPTDHTTHEHIVANLIFII